jgi:1-acyl-sn-glycerol-3-phosphate acyltransferase
MTQNVNATPPPDNSGQPAQAVQSEEHAKPAKPKKNLYEPYKTPPVLYEMLRWFILIVVAIIVRLSLYGLNNVPSRGPFILAPNHLAWVDIPLVALHIHRKVVYMAKEEWFRGKIAWLIRFLGAFPVRRGEADRQALRTAEEQLKQGHILGIFPEGTRSRSGTLAKGHAGMAMIALRTGVPVMPVAIWGSEKALKKFRPRVTIRYGEPVILKPKGIKITRQDIDEATDQVMCRIASMLPPEYRGVYTGEVAGVAATEATVEDSPNNGD